jgi:hypothetical protein
MYWIGYPDQGAVQLERELTLDDGTKITCDPFTGCTNINGATIKFFADVSGSPSNFDIVGDDYDDIYYYRDGIYAERFTTIQERINTYKVGRQTGGTIGSGGEVYTVPLPPSEPENPALTDPIHSQRQVREPSGEQAGREPGKQLTAEEQERLKDDLVREGFVDPETGQVIQSRVDQARDAAKAAGQYMLEVKTENRRVYEAVRDYNEQVALSLSAIQTADKEYADNKQAYDAVNEFDDSWNDFRKTADKVNDLNEKIEGESDADKIRELEDKRDDLVRDMDNSHNKISEAGGVLKDATVASSINGLNNDYLALKNGESIDDLSINEFDKEFDSETRDGIDDKKGDFKKAYKKAQDDRKKEIDKIKKEEETIQWAQTWGAGGWAVYQQTMQLGRSLSAITPAITNFIGRNFAESWRSNVDDLFDTYLGFGGISGDTYCRAQWDKTGPTDGFAYMQTGRFSYAPGAHVEAERAIVFNDEGEGTYGYFVTGAVRNTKKDGLRFEIKLEGDGEHTLVSETLNKDQTASYSREGMLYYESDKRFRKVCINFLHSKNDLEDYFDQITGTKLCQDIQEETR